MKSRLKELSKIKDCRLYPGIDEKVWHEIESLHQFVLPSIHKDALQESNGAEAYGGYIRLFGVASGNSLDSIQWNRTDYWKFAWQGRCSNYWCFAETAWGDQYAYDIDGLRSGKDDIYLLDSIAMTPTYIAVDFSQFLRDEFFRIANEPYDVMTKLARQKFGDLDVSSHIVYSLSLLLGGEESISNIEKMDARSAMICNGDIAVQVDAAAEGARLLRLESYQDEARRVRLRLVWS